MTRLQILTQRRFASNVLIDIRKARTAIPDEFPRRAPPIAAPAEQTPTAMMRAREAERIARQCGIAEANYIGLMTNPTLPATIWDEQKIPWHLQRLDAMKEVKVPEQKAKQWQKALDAGLPEPDLYVYADEIRHREWSQELGEHSLQAQRVREQAARVRLDPIIWAIYLDAYSSEYAHVVLLLKW